MRARFLSRLTFFVFLLGFLTVAATAQAPKPAALSGPPKTEVKEVKETIHGVEIVDPYRWLEDQNSPETRAWIGAENAYTESVLSKLPGRDQLHDKLSGFLKIDSMGFPTVRKGRYFFSKRRADQDQSVMYVRRGITGQDEVLVDPLPMSPDHTITVGLGDVTNDGTLIAYWVRQGGEDEETYHLMNVDTKKELSDQFPRARYFGFSILPDKSGLYYTKLIAEGPRVFYHKLGSDPSTDIEIFGKGYGKEKIIGSGVSEDGHYLQIAVFYGSSATKIEVYVKDLIKKTPIVPILNDI